MGIQEYRDKRPIGVFSFFMGFRAHFQRGEIRFPSWFQPLMNNLISVL